MTEQVMQCKDSMENNIEPCFVYTNCDRLSKNLNTRLWMHSLLQQKNKNFRIIIVDSSSQNTETDVKDIVCCFVDNHINCKMLSVSKLDIFNKPLFLNTGALYAHKKYHSKHFCFSDVDIVYCSDFVDRYIEHVKTTKFPNKLFGPTMRSIKGFSKPYPSDNFNNVFENILNCNPSIKTWKNIPGGCQCCRVETFLAVNGYNDHVPFNCEDTNFRKKCEGKYGRQTKFNAEEFLIFHLPHEKTEYRLKTQDKTNEILRANVVPYNDSIKTCDILEEFENE